MSLSRRGLLSSAGPTLPAPSGGPAGRRPRPPSPFRLGAERRVGSVTSPRAVDGYAVNLDPNLRTTRFFRKDGGVTTVPADAPLLVRAGPALSLRIGARGSRIEVFVEGLPTIDVTDTRHARGRIGLEVFGGRAVYQDTYVRAL
ncbi:hypothetical protein [Streptomyces atratus]|uniref:hypothetical protein n=1 Tax=Streptomyces atratus TaxID=1893 RepID=UPI0033C981A4